MFDNYLFDYSSTRYARVLRFLTSSCFPDMFFFFHLLTEFLSLTIPSAAPAAAGLIFNRLEQETEIEANFIFFIGMNTKDIMKRPIGLLCNGRIKYIQRPARDRFLLGVFGYTRFEA